MRSIGKKPARRGRDLLSRIDAALAELTEVRRLIVAARPQGRLGGILDDWLAARCDTTNAGARAYSSALYVDFLVWCDGVGNADAIVTMTALGCGLRARGFQTTKDGRGRRVRHGITLKARQGCR